MKRIAVVTSTRAEYGLLAPVVRELRKREDEDLRVDLIVTGTHLSHAYGFTVAEVREDGVRVDHEVPVSVDSGSALDISKNQAEALVRFTELFSEQNYNAVLLLGDRYEILSVAMAAGNTRTPIFHIGGGDTTEGAIDECIRHSVTKMSWLHFPSNEESHRRIIQLGEAPERVFNYGSTSIDNILNIATLSKAEAMASVSLSNERYALCTYHPVTLEAGDISVQMNELLNAIRAFPDIDFLTTKSNADQGGEIINELLDQAEENIPNLHVFTSLGARRYLSLMRYAQFVLGNSSSGIIEAPALHVPTVNIGDRQRGRLRAESVIDCPPDMASIVHAIKKAMSDEMKARCRTVVSPYGDGRAAPRIAAKSVEVVQQGIDLKKKFYDVDMRAAS
ncbi:MAG: UDP-N-acetylglucosamine 2-epimerase (hydrolyzing) [Synergistaceae bacterium]|nr:UDP-N-acetylglucosamine 2-epimerase (hydrolyzing) [Synergistaceae bacterium]